MFESFCETHLESLQARKQVAGDLRWRSLKHPFDAGAVHFKELGGKQICRPTPHSFPVLEPMEPAIPELRMVATQIARPADESILGAPEPVTFGSRLPAIGAKLPAVKAQSHMIPVNLAPCLKALKLVLLDVYAGPQVSSGKGCRRGGKQPG